MKFNKGQSLLELMVAIGIFAISISALAFFVLDSFVSGRLAQELVIANSLAEEGLEAARSIRDNNWDDLTAGNHGLAILNGHWVFQGNQEDISDQLRSGIRQIQIEDVDSNRKRVISRVNWQFTEGRPQELSLTSYFSNWQVTSLLEIRKPTAHTDFSGKTTNPENAYDYPDGNTFAATKYDATANPSITFHTWELPTKSYTSLVLKYRYSADKAKDDQYAIAYSTTTCEGSFIDLVPPTSAEVADNTVSVNLSPDQDLSQLCLKIYSIRIGKADGKNLYTRDIWTEGYYLP